MKKIGLILLLLFGTMFLATREVHAINRIGVRQGADSGEFYDTVTNEKFIFRGNNPTLNTEDTSAIQQTLDLIQQNGYNAIRIFPNFNQLGSESGGLSSTYMDKIAYILQESAKRNIYVLVAFEILPEKGSYYPPGEPIPWWDQANRTIQDQNINKYYMVQSFIDAKKRFIQDFIQALQEPRRNVPMSVILGYEIENEMLFTTDQYPLNQTGMVTTADGVTYNMGDETQRKQAMSANLVYWSNELKKAIKAVDPQALTALSPFPPTALSGNLTLETYWMFVDPENGGSSADFVDLHPYPWIGTLTKQMADYHIGTNKRKPIVMGEFGANKSTYSTLSQGVTALRDWQVQSCQYSFQGWWTWIWGNADTDFYSVLDGNGAINNVLAPIYRADPCKTDNTPLTMGYLGPVSCTSFSGWAGTTTSPGTQLQIHFYADGTQFLGAATANISREKNVCDTLGYSQTPCTHGFSFAVPNSLKDGKTHTIDAYAINANNPQLQDSGQTIQCAVQVKGDLNNDGHVTIADYNELVTNFGNPYTIFTFNDVIENFGK